MPTTRVTGGKFYRKTPDDRLEEVPPPPRPPDVWICRRVADFPNGRIPDGAAVAACTRCDAPIAYNPARPYTTPRVCMQCANIQPL